MFFGLVVLCALEAAAVGGGIVLAAVLVFVFGGHAAALGGGVHPFVAAFAEDLGALFAHCERWWLGCFGCRSWMYVWGGSSNARCC